MSKTYRFNSKKRVQDRQFNKTESSTEGEVYTPNYDGYDWVKGTIDVDWAMKRMAPRINYLLNNLARGGVILDSDIEDFRQKFNIQIIKAAGKYDPDHVGKSGRKSSPLHYLRVVERSITAAICSYAKLKTRTVPLATPQISDDDEEEDSSTAGVIERVASDGCFSMKKLFFRMDYFMFLKSLTPVERCVLLMLLNNCTQDAIAEEVSRFTKKNRDRDHVRKVILIHMQKKARRYDFIPWGPRNKTSHLREVATKGKVDGN